MIDMYGIPNCGSVKKAKTWLEDHKIEYSFHDVKKEGVDKALVDTWLPYVHWSQLLNKRSLTWRNLGDDDKLDLDELSVVDLLCRYPTMIKRPVLVHGKGVDVGFNIVEYQKLLA